jgi:MFS family permease
VPKLPFAHIIAVLRHRNYRIFIAGNALSMIGLWTQRVAVGWLAWELTRSGAWLGAVAFADLCPSIIVGPFAGVLADRIDRIKIMYVAQTLSMLQALALSVLAISGTITIGMLLALVLLNGVITGINQPARLAVVSSLVPRANLSTAVALNSIAFNLARFVGPAVAGALIVGVGVGVAFAVNAASFLAFLIALARIRLPADARPVRPGVRRGVLADIAQGLRYVCTHPGIGPLLALSVATGMGLRCFVELLPGFAADVFGHGAGGLAALASSIGVGAVAGGLWVAQRGTAPGLARLALIHSLFTVLAVLAFAATDVFWVGLAGAAAAGVFMSVSGIAAQTIVQMAADPAMRGRTLSVYGLIMRAAPAAGALLLGLASEVAGLRLPLVLSAIACLLVWLRVWRAREAIDAALAEPAAGS